MRLDQIALLARQAGWDYEIVRKELGNFRRFAEAVIEAERERESAENHDRMTNEGGTC